MIRTIFNNRNIKSIANVFAIAMISFFASCNKDFQNKLDFDGDVSNQDIKGTEYKIAYLVIEGGVGAIVGQQATDYGKMPNLAAVSLNSVFSWNSISNENKNISTSFADLLTGVEVAKHQVKDGTSSNNIQNYPTLFKRVKQYTASKTALFTTNSIYKSFVEDNVLDSYTLSTNDEEVKNNAVEEIKKDNAGVVLASFGDAYKVGEAQGYNSEAYLNALNSIDTKIGDILGTIKARKNYANEKWLIVITSNRGGKYELDPFVNDGSIYSDTERNNFVVMHNNQFGYKNIERLETVDPAWTSNAVKYTGSTGFAKLNESASNAFNFGSGVAGQDFTVSLKLKMITKPASTVAAANGVIIGKHSSVQNSSAGWSIVYNGHNGWRFQAAGGTVVDNQVLELNTWYSLTAKVYKDGTVRRAKVFRNGVQVGTIADVTSRNMSENNVALQFGYKNGAYGSNSGYSHIISDVRIYNVALPDDVIKAYSCGTLFFPSQPYYSNLMGYWPGNDNGMEIKDKSGNNRHMQLSGSYAWTSFSERSANLCPTLPEKLELYTVRSLDAPRTIYNWLNILETSNFNLDAQLWSPSFVKK